jgi:hypothetical protein
MSICLVADITFCLDKLKKRITSKYIPKVIGAAVRRLCRGRVYPRPLFHSLYGVRRAVNNAAASSAKGIQQQVFYE